VTFALLLLLPALWAGAAEPMSGLSARLQKLGEGVYVVDAAEGSPARKGGLRCGDRIEAVDGAPTAGESLEQVVARIRGPQRAPVSLTVARAGRKKPLTLSFVRQALDVAPRFDARRKFKEIEDCADEGWAACQYHLGLMFNAGDGVGRDLDKALKWQRLAADQDLVEAQYALAAMRQALKDPAQAAAWARRAADSGHVPSMLLLADLSAGNKAAELEWLTRAAEKGDTVAACRLAPMHLKGEGTPPNFEAAFAWAKRAQGVPCGQDLLGTYYEKGQGIGQDKVEAYKWYALAAAGGHKSAQARRDELSAALSPEQLQDAQRRAAQFKTAALPAVEKAAPRLPSVEEPSYKRPESDSDLALVVGIESYKSLPKADYAERDAEAVRRHLLALGVPARNMIFLKGADATKSQLQAYLEEWLPRNAGPDSRVFFYYSGHGAPDASTGQAYLLPWDGDAKFLQSTAYPLAQVYSALDKLKARQVVAALDACFSGAGGRSVLPRGARPLVNKLETPASGRLTLFTAAGGDEITGSLDEARHGAFTYWLLRGFSEAKDGSGKVTAKSLFEFLKPKVEDEARRQNRSQTPGLVGPDEEFLP